LKPKIMNSLNLDTASLQEQLSALHDGQLDAAQAAMLVNASLQDESVLLQWRSLSAISHVMNDPTALQVAARPASLAARAQVAPSTSTPSDGVFRWKMVAGIAGFAAIGSLIWGLSGAAGSPGLQQGGSLASNSNNAPVTLVSAPTFATGKQPPPQIGDQEQVMIRNPRLDELLAAHKQFGGISALQQPAGSLRSVSLGNTPATNGRQ
jgi:sigma-E factor negative regulatory protein RseA